MTHTHEPGETASAPMMRLHLRRSHDEKGIAVVMLTELQLNIAHEAHHETASAPILRLHLPYSHGEKGIAVVMLTELQLNIAHEAHHAMERRIPEVEREAR